MVNGGEDCRLCLVVHGWMLSAGVEVETIAFAKGMTMALVRQFQNIIVTVFDRPVNKLVCGCAGGAVAGLGGRQRGTRIAAGYCRVIFLSATYSVANSHWPVAA